MVMMKSQIDNIQDNICYVMLDDVNTMNDRHTPDGSVVEIQ